MSTRGRRKKLPLLDGADMLYMALADGIRLDPDAEEPISVLLVDEAQDSNAARREMCLRLQRDSGCRVVAVGMWSHRRMRLEAVVGADGR